MTSSPSDDETERTVRSKELRAITADWESEHGAFTASERRKARRDLGLLDER